MQINLEYLKTITKDMGSHPPHWTKLPSGQWKGICTITRNPKELDSPETWDIEDFKIDIDFETHRIKGTAQLMTNSNEIITLDAKFSVFGDRDKGGNLFGTMTINTKTPVVCPIIFGEVREKGIAGAFYTSETDENGNSYSGRLEIYSPDIDD